MRDFSPEELKVRGMIPRKPEALSACAKGAGKG